MSKQVRYVFGLSLLGIGITLTLQAGLGAGVWDLLAFGLMTKYGVTFGFWQNVSYITIISMVSLVFKKKFKWQVLIPGIFLGVFIDILMLMDFTAILGSWTMIILGSLIIGVGISLYTSQNLLPTAVDYLMLEINENTKLDEFFSKLITDLFPLIVSLILGFKPEIGTLVTFVLVPITMRFYVNIFN